MTPKVTDKQLAEAYQPLFDLMADEYDKLLVEHEMDEIISASYKVTENIDTLYESTCDVEGCDNIPSSGGLCWRETGYWSVCMHHSNDHKLKPQPTMKKEAIEREASRNPDGTLPIN